MAAKFNDSFILPTTLATTLFAVNWQSIRISPDSAHYIRMAYEAEHYGLFTSSIFVWPPGFPWLMALVSVLTPLNYFEAGNLIISASAAALLWVCLRLLTGERDQLSLPMQILVSCGFSLFLFHSLISSTMGTELMTELPFTALCYAGVYSLYLWRRTPNQCQHFHWAFLFMSLSFTFRYIGAVGLIYCFSFLLWAIRKGHYKISWRLRFWAPIFLSLFVWTAVVLNNLWNHHFIFMPGRDTINTPILGHIFNYFQVIFSYLNVLNQPYLSPCIALFFVFSITIMKMKPLKELISRHIDILTWLSAYTTFTCYLISQYDIRAMHRYVIPALPTLIIIYFYPWIHTRKPFKKIVLAILASLLIATGGGVFYLVNEKVMRYQPQAINHFKFRQSANFAQIKSLVEKGQHIYWLATNSKSYYWGMVFSAHFYCKPMTFITSAKQLRKIKNNSILAADASLPRFESNDQEFIEPRLSVIRINQQLSSEHIKLFDFKNSPVIPPKQVHHPGC